MFVCRDLPNIYLIFLLYSQVIRKRHERKEQEVLFLDITDIKMVITVIIWKDVWNGPEMLFLVEGRGYYFMPLLFYQSSETDEVCIVKMKKAAWIDNKLYPYLPCWWQQRPKRHVDYVISDERKSLFWPLLYRYCFHHI